MRYRSPIRERLRPLARAVKRDRQLRRMLLWPLLGGLYCAFILLTGLAVGCPFRALTGRLCPGCGATTMFVRLARLELGGAFESNPLLFCLLPFAAFLYCSSLWRRFKGAPPRLVRLKKGLLLLLAAGLAVFGILRNL